MSTELEQSGRRLLFTEARTARRFAPTPVADTTLREIDELARLPPTSGNVNPLRILFVPSLPGTGAVDPAVR